MADPSEALDEGAIREYRDAAVAVVEAAGPIALRYFRKTLDVEDKSGGHAFDPVTRADREIEAHIREDLGRRFPGHGVLGEEHPELESDSPFRWVVDPIDGTRAFISGVPAWGILLGLTVDGACVAGAMHQPYIGETFYGDTRGSAIRRGGQETVLRTSKTEDVGSAILYCTHPSMFECDTERRVFDGIEREVRMSRFGGDCYSYGLLAHGLIDLVIEGGLQPYDIIPMIPIIEGAGGVVTNWQGEPADPGGFVVAAANARLHAETLKRLNA